MFCLFFSQRDHLRLPSVRNSLSPSARWNVAWQVVPRISCSTAFSNRGHYGKRSYVFGGATRNTQNSQLESQAVGKTQASPSAAFHERRSQAAAWSFGFEARFLSASALKAKVGRLWKLGGRDSKLCKYSSGPGWPASVSKCETLIPLNKPPTKLETSVKGPHRITSHTDGDKPGPTPTWPFVLPVMAPDLSEGGASTVAYAHASCASSALDLHEATGE